MSIALSRTGTLMPLMGFGLWKVNKPTCADTVYNAIKAGYRLFDGAGDYGNEKEAGEGVRRAIADGLVKREELFITSKLWNTFHAKEHVANIAKMQLGLWGIDYFDLFLIHFPVSLEYVDPSVRYPPEWYDPKDKIVHLANIPIAETWKEMEGLVDAGLAKNIGISNFQASLIIDLMRYARYQPQVLQVEIHPYLTQEPLVRFAQNAGIAITAYSSFGPASYIELDMDQGAESLFELGMIQSLGQKYGKTAAQVLLRWSTQRNIAVIPKSNYATYLAQNLDSLGFDLTQEEIKGISSLNRNLRMNDPADIDVRMSIFA